jgi:hypothetical protein
MRKSTVDRFTVVRAIESERYGTRYRTRCVVCRRSIHKRAIRQESLAHLDAEQHVRLFHAAESAAIESLDED